MSYKNFGDPNQLNKFFCPSCDKLFSDGAFQNLQTKELQCPDCVRKLTHQEPSPPGFRKEESLEEICQCLKLIEPTLRITRSENPEIVQQTDVICDECGQTEALFFCQNDEMLFCETCFEAYHTKPGQKRHTKLTISEWKAKQNPPTTTIQTKWFCEIHRVEPVYCLIHSQLECFPCTTHLNAVEVKEIAVYAEEVKQRLGFHRLHEIMGEKLGKTKEIQTQLEKYITDLQKKIERAEGLLQDIQSQEESLKTGIWSWKQIEKELNPKEWGKNEFVSQIKSTLEKVQQKWVSHEQQIQQRLLEIDSLSSTWVRLGSSPKSPPVSPETGRPGLHSSSSEGIQIELQTYPNLDEEQQKFNELKSKYQKLSQQFQNSSNQLKLRDQRFNDEEFELICLHLKDSRWEGTVLDLGRTNLNTRRLGRLCQCLERNQSLQRLSLNGNEINSQGSDFIKSLLFSNATLTLLHLGGNQLGDQGAISISEGLRKNKTLKELWLYENNMGDEGKKALDECLDENLSLIWLGLKFCTPDFKLKEWLNLKSPIERSIYDKLIRNQKLQTQNK